jgi:serine/threonine protein kinase/tetratricopeptide (TPR) repeat protein
MIGRQLGHYRILAMLGAGGMGEVYRAHDERLDRDVALKLLPASSFEDSTARARLVREARAAAALNHASICTIHDVGEAEGQAYIAMELVEGRPLSERAHGQALPVDEVLSYGIQIAAALAHAHARGVVHRDLKSANIVVTSDRRVKVLDFGLARKMSAPGPTGADTERLTGVSLTERGTIVGTIAYMAPEQLRGQPADVRSDIWALGVMLYELAGGTKPFTGQSSFEVSSNILSQPPSPLSPGVPVALRAVIDTCLEKDPARRYQTANEACASLQTVQTGHASPWTMLDHHLARRRWLLPVLVALILASVLAGLNFKQMRLRWQGTASPVESLAVLPMVNLSGDSAQDYFADGITEVLSTDLARLGGFKRVIARGSVLRYKGTSKPLEEIARDLHVDALVTGSVLRSGDRVSITAQLLDPATGAQLWTNRYERSLQDVLVLRNEIVSAIVREIRMKLSPAEAARLASAGSVNTEAFEAYLKGRFHWLKQTSEDYDLAERYFQSALDKDPAYALAYAGLASVWMMRGDAGFQPPSETFPKARPFLAKAFELDDSVADLHVELATNLLVVQWDWAGAEREFKRAIELNPNLADAHFFYADLLVTLKRQVEWDREIQRALELDPLNDFIWTYYGWELNYVGRYDEAIPIFKRLLPTGPNKSANHLGLWGAYYRKGMYDQALASAKEFFAAAGDGEFIDALGSGGDVAAYRAGMKRAGEAMGIRSTQRHVPAIRIARMFAHAGDTGSALHWLEQAYANHEAPMTRLGVVWDWHDLHSEPRFQDLLRRLNLPQ